MAKRAKASEPSEGSEPSEPERQAGIVTVDEPRIDPPPEVEARPQLPSPPPRVPPAAPPRTASGASFGDRIGRFLRFLWRLVLLLIFLGLLSVLLYLAVPWLYQTFLRPLEQNTSQVRELKAQQQQTAQELADLQTRLETIEGVQNEQDGTLTDLDERMQEIETEIAARTESLAAIERLQSELEEQNQEVSAELERQINLLKAMELLSRARLSMYQSNFGLAKQDVEIARDLLAMVQPDAPQKLGTQLDAVLLRLDLTLSNLPDFPVAASDDLDSAWQILLSGQPQSTPTLVESPTLPPTPIGTISATPTGVPTSTPTPLRTVSPTPTP
jgi:hypothetical protein